MDQNKRDIANLFNAHGADLGLDEDSSSIIIHNLNASTIPMCQGSPFLDEEQATDDFRIIFFALDGSSSMHAVESDLRQTFNEIIIPGLLGGALDLVGGIRIGGLMFANRISPLWQQGFHPVQELPKLEKDYFTSGMTALHQGILDAVTASTAYSLELFNKTGTMPEVVLAVLSDGANNQAPLEKDPVYNVLSKLSQEIFTTVFIGFETGEPVDFRHIATELGFRDIQDVKRQPGESVSDMQRRFRHTMKVFSGSLINRASRSKVGNLIKADGSTGFFD